MQKLIKIYEGKAKQLFTTSDENLLIQYFKDDATAFNNLKKDVISTELVARKRVKRLDNREQLVKKARIIPLEVIVRNITAGSMAKRLGVDEGTKLENPIFEICYKDDSLGDPLINDDHAITVLKVVTKEQLEEIKTITKKINKELVEIFAKINIKLVDFKIEFGFDGENNIILADEISPDSCRLWDDKTDNKLDKDRFRRGLGGLVEAYKEVASRLGILIK